MLHFLRSIGFVTALAALPAAQAQGPLAAGQKPDAAQIQSLGLLESVEIDGQHYRVLKTQDITPGPAVTFVLNAEGMVGESTHQVVITRQPVEVVRQHLGTLTIGFAEATYYDHMQITLLSFPTLQQAVQGLGQIRAALPKAKVQLPIRFGNENLR